MATRGTVIGVTARFKEARSLLEELDSKGSDA